MGRVGWVSTPDAVWTVLRKMGVFNMLFLNRRGKQCSRLGTLWRIIIPLVKPGIIAGSILVFIPSLGAYVTPRVLGGGKSMMLGNLIELQFGQGRDWPLGAALSITLMVIVTLALLVYVRNASKGGGGHG